ncbi:hypothetical protein RSAG8_02238, partial [Rhizoctonia solani AG-8 WAC10335]
MSPFRPRTRSRDYLKYESPWRRQVTDHPSSLVHRIALIPHKAKIN